jgi:hypothetical protein
MSVLSGVTSLLEPTTNLGNEQSPSDQYQQTQYQPTTSDNYGNDQQQGREESKNDHQENQAKYDDYSNNSNNNDGEKQGKNDDQSKYGKNDDHSNDGKYGDHSNEGKYDDHSKDAKYDECQPQKDYCAPPNSSGDYGKGDAHGPGAELSKFDFSHGDYGSPAPDHSGDMQGALASMSSGHALDYAIGQMGAADHSDVGHFDTPADTSHASHDMAHHG